jgi:hypothetical protein
MLTCKRSAGSTVFTIETDRDHALTPNQVPAMSGPALAPANATAAKTRTTISMALMTFSESREVSFGGR